MKFLEALLCTIQNKIALNWLVELVSKGMDG